MLAIPLPNGEHTCVDEAQFDELAKYNWRLANGYVAATIDGKNVFMSRFIMNPSKGKVVDHINGNRLINTESNLRVCTISQNNKNMAKFTNNTSGHKGVSWNKLRNKWHVEIRNNGVRHHIGYFDNLEDAVEASVEAYAKYHGEFSYFEREEVDMTKFYMAKWHPKSIELFAKKQEPKSSGILNIMDLTVAIPTTKNQVAIIDIFDYNLVSQHKWHAMYNKGTGSYYAGTCVRKADSKQSTLEMQRFIKEAKPGEVVDHINGITNDNRRINLRITDRSGNTRNTKVYSNNKSGVPGVGFNTSNGTWNASYSKNGKPVHIGSYKTKEEAIAARLAVVTVEYGEFLRTAC